MKTPQYITKENIEVRVSGGDTKTLPQGSFVKTIKLEYVPKHIKERDGLMWFNPDLHVYVYCHFGIACVRWELLREDKD